jgi:cytochrome c-type biogenesis protein
MAQGFNTGSGAIALALTTGVITAFNPCGFAMLPAYVSYFVGSTTNDQPKSTPERLARASLVGAVVTLGFVTVFGILGIVATGLRGSVTKATPYISMFVGVVLVVLAVAMIRGFEPKLSFLKIGRASQGSSLKSMYVYGLSYAVISLSCGFAGFLGTVASAFREDSIVHAMSVYLAFALGMGLVLLIVSIAAALAQQTFIRGLKKILPYVNRVSGALLLLAGLYVSWYGWYEYQLVVKNKNSSSDVIDGAFSLSGKLQNWISGIPAGALSAAVAGVAAVAIGSFIMARKNRHQDLVVADAAIKADS